MTEVDPSPRAVINASPLIFLSKAGYLNLLQLISEEILVPDPVAAEIGRRGPDDITAKALEETDWLRVVHAPALPTVIGSWDLGPAKPRLWASSTGSSQYFASVRPRRTWTCGGSPTSELQN